MAKCGAECVLAMGSSLFVSSSSIIAHFVAAPPKTGYNFARSLLVRGGHNNLNVEIEYVP